jgi:hypothetical protein
MPKYRIFAECLINLIYEVDAASKEEAQKIWDEKDYHDGLDLAGATEGPSRTQVPYGNYEATGKIVIEEI